MEELNEEIDVVNVEATEVVEEVVAEEATEVVVEEVAE